MKTNKIKTNLSTGVSKLRYPDYSDVNAGGSKAADPTYHLEDTFKPHTNQKIDEDLMTCGGPCEYEEPCRDDVYPCGAYNENVLIGDVTRRKQN